MYATEELMDELTYKRKDQILYTLGIDAKDKINQKLYKQLTSQAWTKRFKLTLQ